MATQTTSTQAPAWYQQYASNLAGLGQGLAQRPFTPFPGQQVAPLTDQQRAGVEMMQTRAAAGSPVMTQANNLLGQTLGGNFLQGNPYLDAISNQTNQQVTSQVNRMFGNNANAWGSSPHQQVLARELSDAQNRLRYQNYGDERQRQMQSMLFAPQAAAADYADANAMLQAGGVLQGQNQNIANANYNEFMRAQEWPFKGLGAFGSALGFNPGSTSTVTTPDPSRASTVLGGALTGGVLGNMLGGSPLFPGISNTVLGAGLGGLLGLFG